MSYFFERFIYHFVFYMALLLVFVFGFIGHASEKVISKILFYLLTLICLLFVVSRVIASLNGVDNLWDFFIWVREHITFAF